MNGNPKCSLIRYAASSSTISHASINSMPSTSDKKPNVALRYLHLVLENEQGSSEDIQSMGLTHLNLCVTYSQLNKHSIALQHAQSAIEIFKSLIGKTDDFIYDKLIASHYNAAVECEHLKKPLKALVYYQNGITVCNEHPNVKNGLRNKLQQSFQELSIKQQRVQCHKIIKESAPSISNITSPFSKISNISHRLPIAHSRYFSNIKVKLPQRPNTTYREKRTNFQNPNIAKLSHTYAKFIPTIRQRSNIEIRKPVHYTDKSEEQSSTSIQAHTQNCMNYIEQVKRTIIPITHKAITNPPKPNANVLNYKENINLTNKKPHEEQYDDEEEEEELKKPNSFDNGNANIDSINSCLSKIDSALCQFDIPSKNKKESMPQGTAEMHGSIQSSIITQKTSVQDEKKPITITESTSTNGATASVEDYKSKIEQLLIAKANKIKRCYKKHVMKHRKKAKQNSHTDTLLSKLLGIYNKKRANIIAELVGFRKKYMKPKQQL